MRWKQRNSMEKEAAESYDEWSSTTLRRIREASPIEFKSYLTIYRFETLDKCLVREYRVSLRGISKHVSSNFFEGVRARMVDKDFPPKFKAGMTTSTVWKAFE
ncbi:unnamed protein product [Sphenostylis stenocarpa]|uniref:3-hydroxyisobutyryl-CoA hydrolase n=1 Tax=Sphenostylis stenocarpa TaxID=92480 RepID=A0AA86VP57_9FABA|nr:unnamed protein product [Sphenostylis stenocarpa]